jgi:starvation-inducible DNA-binding protein
MLDPQVDALAHMGALDVVYAGVIGAHRKAIDATEETDPVTHDMLIGQTAQLEQFQWFVRAHVENSSGALATNGAKTERGAASSAR